MSGFVVDNSVVVSWFFNDEMNAYTRAIRRKLDTEQAFVPALWPLEFSNVLLAAERRKRLTEADVSQILTILQSTPISVEQEPPERAWTEILSLARSQGLTTYDASYLDLAMRMGLPLATLDKALKKAARKVQVPLYKP